MKTYLANQVQILDEADCFLLDVNALRKGINPFLMLLAMGKYVLSSLGKFKLITTGLADCKENKREDRRLHLTALSSLKKRIKKNKNKGKKIFK